MFKYLITILLLFSVAAFAQTTEKSIEQQKAVSELSAMFIDGHNILLLFALIGLGAIAKSMPTKVIQDWSIILLVPILGCALGVGLFSYTTHDYPWLVALLIGGSDGIIAVFGHQFLKQLLQSPAAPLILKIPCMTTVAALLGIDTTLSMSQTKSNKSTT